MSDENPVVPVVSPVPVPPNNQPEIPALTIPAASAAGGAPQTNEPLESGDATPKTSLLEKIRATGARIIETRGIIFRKGRGRPRKDQMPGKDDEIISGAPDSVPGSAAAGPVAVAPGAPAPDTRGSFLLRRVVVSAVKGAKGVARYVARRKAEEAELDRDFIKRSFEAAEPTAEEWKDFEESTALVLQKYQIQTQYDEILLWVTDLTRLFKGDVLLIKTFNEEIERRRREREIAAAAAKKAAEQNQP